MYLTHDEITEAVDYMLLNGEEEEEFRMLMQTCEEKGHDLVDGSMANAETGNMGVECQRCGFEHYVTLY